MGGAEGEGGTQSDKGLDEAGGKKRGAFSRKIS